MISLTATEVIERKAHPMDDAPIGLLPWGALCEAEIVIAVRDAASDLTGGNCAFADDDLRILTHLAARAVEAGLTDQLSASVQANITRKAQQNHPPRVTEKW